MTQTIDYTAMEYTTWSLRVCLVCYGNGAKEVEFAECLHGPIIEEYDDCDIYTTLVFRPTKNVSIRRIYESLISRLGIGFLRQGMDGIDMVYNEELLFFLSEIVMPWIVVPLSHYMLRVSDEYGYPPPFEYVYEDDTESDSWTHEDDKN